MSVIRPTTQLLNEYKRARARAFLERDERVADAYRRVPRLEAISEQKKKLAFELGLRLVNEKDPQRAREETAAALLALDAEAKALMAQNGIAPDALLPRFSCPICEDTGFVGEPKTICKCLRERAAREKYASSAFMQNSFRDFDLGIFRDERQRKLMAAVKRVGESYAQNLEYNGAKGLLLLGETGLGKTFLLNCIASRAVENGYNVDKYTMYNFQDRVRESIYKREATALSVTDSDLLILDDLGAEAMIPNITVESLHRVINERQDAGLATAFATNLTKKALLERYGERIFSRLVYPKAVSVVVLEGVDVRVR